MDFSNETAFKIDSCLKDRWWFQFDLKKITWSDIFEKSHVIVNLNHQNKKFFVVQTYWIMKGREIW